MRGGDDAPRGPLELFKKPANERHGNIETHMATQAAVSQSVRQQRKRTAHLRFMASMQSELRECVVSRLEAEAMMPGHKQREPSSQRVQGGGMGGRNSLEPHIGTLLAAPPPRLPGLRPGKKLESCWDFY